MAGGIAGTGMQHKALTPEEAVQAVDLAIKENSPYCRFRVYRAIHLPLAYIL